MFTSAHVLDVLERAACTFAQAFLAVLIATNLAVDDPSVWRAAAVAGALAVIKGFAAGLAGAPDSASLLPARVDPPTGRV
jgi:hypothetical protein